MCCVDSFAFCRLESEVAMRLTLEGDLGGLRKALEEWNASRASLQVQADNLQEELACLKRNHKEVSMDIAV